VSADWVAKRVRFGRFLSFFNTSCIEDAPPAAHWKLPANLTEGAFRRLWEATAAGGNYSGHKANTEAAKKDEQRRFGEVVAALTAGGEHRKRQPVGKAIVARLPGKGWMTAEEITELVAPDLEGLLLVADVEKALYRIKPTPKVPYRAVKALRNGQTVYKVQRVKGRLARPEQIAAWAPELIPLLDRLIAEGKKHRAEMSQPTICELAGKIKMVIESALNVSEGVVTDEATQ